MGKIAKEHIMGILEPEIATEPIFGVNQRLSSQTLQRMLEDHWHWWLWVVTADSAGHAVGLDHSWQVRTENLAFDAFVNEIDWKMDQASSCWKKSPIANGIELDRNDHVK